MTGAAPERFPVRVWLICTGTTTAARIDMTTRRIATSRRLKARAELLSCLCVRNAHMTRALHLTTNVSSS